MTQDEVAAVREIALAILTPLQDELLKDIARHVLEAGECTSTAKYKAYLARTLGATEDQIAAFLQAYLPEIDAQLAELLEYAAEHTVAFEDNGSLQNVVEGYVKVAGEETRRHLERLGGYGPDGQYHGMRELYRVTMDHAFRASMTGAQTPSEAARKAMRNLADHGIRTIEDSAGRTLGIEYAVRRSLINQMGALNEQIQQANHDALGCDGWEISAHSACAEDHEFCQGRQYSDKEFQALNRRLKRRIGTLQCKHIASPIKLGVSIPQYTEAELQAMAEENAAGVIYEGQHYTQYEATQEQANIENKMRTMQRRILTDQETGDTGQLRKDRITLARLEEEYERFCAGTGLRPAWERAAVAKPSQKGSRPLNQLTYLSDFSEDDRKTIEEELEQIPRHVRETAESCIKGIRRSDEDFGASYDPVTQEILICDHRKKNALVHEYGHALERAQKVYSDPAFRAIMQKGLENLTPNDIIEDSETFVQAVYRIESEKFVSIYQGRLYEAYGIYDGNTITLNGMREYFAEGFRVYFEKPELLRLRDPDLYRYIEELVK